MRGCNEPGPFIWLGPDGHRYRVSIERVEAGSDGHQMMVLFENLATGRIRRTRVSREATLTNLVREELEALLRQAR